MTLRLAAVTLLVTGFATAPAHGWTLDGAGFGHGAGLSQYGAYGMAQQGAGYRRILGHYYRGVGIGNVGTRTIRVLMRERARRVAFTGAAALGERAADPGRRYVATRDGSRIAVRGVGRFTAPLVVKGSARGITLLGRALNGVVSGRYRGSFELSAQGGGLAAVNALQIDAYIQGVVPGEMPSSWDLEALKAQAVAARSYALSTDAGGGLFDQYPDTRSQVYRGVGAETSRTNAAVTRTAGEVIVYRQRVATAYYFSTSGGQTENVEFAFPGGSPVPYLRSVQDPYDRISPRYRWSIEYSGAEMARRLRGLIRGRLRAIRVAKTGVSPRIVEAVVVGTKGSVRVTGADLRARLDLPSTWVRFSRR